MATEYYIVKPNKKQTFYLGKRISLLDGIPNRVYKSEPNYCTWENYEDVIEDIWENSPYFLESDLKLSQVREFAYAIYEFCDDKVYFDNDCSDTAKEWAEWDEIDIISDVLSVEEQLSELCLLIPQSEWIETEEDGIKILHEFDTIKQFIINRTK